MISRSDLLNMTYTEAVEDWKSREALVQNPSDIDEVIKEAELQFQPRCHSLISQTVDLPDFDDLPE